MAEYFELDNGVEMVITGLLSRPKVLTRRAPGIVVMHGWSGGKDNMLSRVGPYDELVGPMLVMKGCVVAAIDGYFHGDRIGKGPNDVRDLQKCTEGRVKQKQEAALYWIQLSFDHTLFGMMVREQQCLVDYRLVNRQNYDQWVQDGATSMRDRAKVKIDEILSAEPQRILPRDVESRIRRIADRAATAQ